MIKDRAYWEAWEARGPLREHLDPQRAFKLGDAMYAHARSLGAFGRNYRRFDPMKRIAGSEFCVGLALAAALVGLTGCKVGPNYKAPQTAGPANWTSAMSGGLSKAAADTNLLARWWTVFKDPTLSELIERARVGEPGPEAGGSTGAGGARPARHRQGGAFPNCRGECVGEPHHVEQGVGHWGDERPLCGGV